MAILSMVLPHYLAPPPLLLSLPLLLPGRNTSRSLSCRPALSHAHLDRCPHVARPASCARPCAYLSALRPAALPRPAPMRPQAHFWAQGAVCIGFYIVLWLGADIAKLDKVTTGLLYSAGIANAVGATIFVTFVGCTSFLGDCLAHEQKLARKAAK